ncbi:hypothetical protein B566_EDAN007911 [Ephemera danica]|nr:hypothetical protein B566_EDAN007911 [Ephemera danica]
MALYFSPTKNFFYDHYKLRKVQQLPSETSRQAIEADEHAVQDSSRTIAALSNSATIGMRRKLEKSAIGKLLSIVWTSTTKSINYDKNKHQGRCLNVPAFSVSWRAGGSTTASYICTCAVCNRNAVLLERLPPTRRLIFYELRLLPLLTLIDLYVSLVQLILVPDRVGSRPTFVPRRRHPVRAYYVRALPPLPPRWSRAYGESKKRPEDIITNQATKQTLLLRICARAVRRLQRTGTTLSLVLTTPSLALCSGVFLLACCGDVELNPGPQHAVCAMSLKCKKRIAPTLAALEEHDASIVAVNETWLHSDILDSEIIPAKYVVFRKDRNAKRAAGGVLLAVIPELHPRRLPELETDAEVVATKSVTSTQQYRAATHCKNSADRRDGECTGARDSKFMLRSCKVNANSIVQSKGEEGQPAIKLSATQAVLTDHAWRPHTVHGSPVCTDQSGAYGVHNFWHDHVSSATQVAYWSLTLCRQGDAGEVGRIFVRRIFVRSRQV